VLLRDLLDSPAWGLTGGDFLLGIEI
jgi:hypothetical protein